MHATAQRAGGGPPDPRMEYWRPTAVEPRYEAFGLGRRDTFSAMRRWGIDETEGQPHFV